MSNDDISPPGAPGEGAGQVHIELGDVSFPAECTVEASSSQYWEDSVAVRSGEITLRPPNGLLWDYDTEGRMLFGHERRMTGTCSEARLNSDGTISISLRGPTERMKHSIMTSLEFFGMSNLEMMHWFGRVCKPEVIVQIDQLNLDDSRRPFLYAVPIQGLSASEGGAGIPINDSGVASYQWDDVFAPILERSNSAKERTYWHQDVPKVFGTVMAHDLLEAERIGFRRAQCTADLIRLALHTGNSHFTTWNETIPLSWNAEDALAPVALYPCILVREVSTVKGWIRDLPGVQTTAIADLQKCRERIAYFANKFGDAHNAGNGLSHEHNNALTKREEKLFKGIQRALRWLTVSSNEPDLTDQFIAVWVALEAILDAPEYPNVFGGNRSNIRDAVRASIRELDLPEPLDPLLLVTREMLEGRLMQGQWPLVRKLQIFEAAFGIKLRPDDVEIVRGLQRARSATLHSGDNSTGTTEGDIQRLRNLVERLVMASSEGAYRDIESEPHVLELGEIGPEGGAAPLYVDGKQVPYTMCIRADDEGKQTMEIAAEGRIYRNPQLTIRKATAS